MENDKPLAMAPAQVAVHNLGQFVKSNLVVVITAAVVVVGLAISYFMAESLQSPQDRLNREIDAQVEQAQRMLNAYEPGAQILMSAVDAATQPATELPAEDQWPDNLKSFEEQLSRQNQAVQSLRIELERMTGDESTPKARPASTYADLRSDLERNLDMIDQALAIASKAVNTTSEADPNLDGRNHPVATRLEAILIYYKADLLRQRAALDREDAEAGRARFEAIRGQWQELEAQAAAIEGTNKGTPEIPATRPAAVSATSTRPAGEAKAAPKAAATKSKPPSAPPKAGQPEERPGLLNRLTGGLLGKKGAQAPSEPTPGPAEPTEKVTAPPPSEPVIAETPAPAVVLEKVPTPAERLAKLQAQRGRAVEDIQSADADVSRLSERVATIEKALASKRSAAREAQLKMMSLEDQGVDPTDPEALDRFTREYQAASETYRAAVREAAVLEHGGVSNARPGTDDEQELLKAPLAPVDPKQPMQPSEGLVALQKEFDAAKIQQASLNKLLKSIDTQIAGVKRREQTDAERLRKLRARQAELRDGTKDKPGAVASLQGAIGAVVKAEALEKEALDLLNGPGKRAAQNAKNAASGLIRDAQNQQVSGTENPRLELIVSKSGFLVGHAETLEADLALLSAYIEAQRANDLARHAAMLAKAASMGIPVDTQGQPACAYQAAAAESESDKARAEAVKEAESARIQYVNADSRLKNLWVLHTNVAAVYYLLGTLETGPKAEENRRTALEIFQQSLQDRRDKPEAEPYKPILEGLSKASQ